MEAITLPSDIYYDHCDCWPAAESALLSLQHNPRGYIRRKTNQANSNFTVAPGTPTGGISLPNTRNEHMEPHMES